MESTLVSQGYDLLLYGMGTVFAFLTLLVGITTLMSVVVNKLIVDVPEATPSAVLNASNGTAGAGSTVEPRILKVIQAVITQHRSKK